MTEEKKQSLVILMPCYKEVPSITFRNTVTLLTNIGKYFKLDYIIQDGLYIPMGRNKLVETTINSVDDLTEIDYILWLDSDQTFELDDILTLIHHYKNNQFDILSGQINMRCAVRNAPVIPMAYYMDQNWHPIMVPLADGDFTPCEATSMGCLLMSGAVLKKIMETVPPNEKLFHADYLPNGEFVGEDICFFKRVKVLGLKVAIDNNVQIGHYGFCR